jgi:hypothetical protein
MWRLAAALALALLALPPAPAAVADERVVDEALASVRGALVTLSDVALARALGLFGLSPSTGPITPAEVARYVDALLVRREAEQLAVPASEEGVTRAWEAAGGAALATRLEAAGIRAGWARELIEAQLKVTRFLELRFQAFAFVTEAEVDAALGSGPHDDAARRAARERLRDELAARALAEWTAEARGRAQIRALSATEGPWPAPFSLGPELQLRR